jgi:hypothetical protein
MRRADAALYQAKREGRDRIVAVGTVEPRRGAAGAAAAAGPSAPEK